MDLISLLTQAIQKQASDLHISPGQPPIIRTNGDLAPMEDMPILDADSTKKLIYEGLSADEQKTFEKDWEIDLAIPVPGVARFRVNVFKQNQGVAAAFRPIPEFIPTLDELGMPEIFKKLLELPNGLILVTGPTGSGKSTTLAAMIDYINTFRSDHIITVEDPIEFTHKSKRSLVDQRQLNKDTHDFNMALRSALRQDPDVIMVGEMRDIETIRLALTAAETGHLVLATLHTSSAPRTINRIVDVFPAGEKNIIRNMLAESIQGVISQTLVKKGSGGRVCAFEIMIGTRAIRNLIREDKVAQMYSAIQTGGDFGMCTLDQYLQDLVDKLVISKSVAGEVAVNTGNFAE